MVTDINFEKNKGTAGSATKHTNTLLTAGVSVPANTLTSYGSLSGTAATPVVLHGITVTPASATAGEITKIQLVGAATSELLISGTWKFNQATTFHVPLGVYIDETTTLKFQTATGSPTCDIAPHFGTV